MKCICLLAFLVTSTATAGTPGESEEDIRGFAADPQASTSAQDGYSTANAAAAQQHATTGDYGNYKEVTDQPSARQTINTGKEASPPTLLTILKINGI